MIDYLQPTHPAHFNRNSAHFATSNIPHSCSAQQYFNDKSKSSSTTNKSKRHSIASFNPLHLHSTTITTSTNTSLKSKSACMCALYSSPTSSSTSLASAAPTTFKNRAASNSSISAPSSPSSHSSRARTMKGKAPVLALAQHRQDSQPQQQQQQQQYLYDDNFSYPHNTRMTTYHARPHLPSQHQNQTRHQKRNSYHGNSGQKHQYLQQQFYQQQYHDHYYNQYGHYDQDMYHYNSGDHGSYSNSHGYKRFSCNGNGNSNHHQRSFMHCASVKVETPASLEVTSEASTLTIAAPSKSSVTPAPLPELIISTDTPVSSHKAHSPSMSSSPASSSQVPGVSDGKIVHPHATLPEPSEESAAQSQDQSSDRAKKKTDAALQRLQPAAELDLGLRPPAIDSDVSCSSSVRGSSDCEDDDKALLGSDSNDTDSVLEEEDPFALDRRSRRTRSMQRLVAKNKTLKSSLAQAKADLASERHNRAVIDQIYLKIKKELNAKLEAEELKNANLRAELEQMTMDMDELREKSQSSSYKIGYDSSPYSLTGLSGIGGLMLHHSSIIDDQDDDDVDDSPIVGSVPERHVASDFFSGDKDPAEQDDDEDSACYLHDESFGFGKVGARPDEVHAEEDEVSKDSKPVDRKVTFVTPDNSPPISPPTASAGGSALVHEDSLDDDGNADEAPCTMMEILMKKQRSQSPEDQVQDPPADVNETFDSMAHKFLHQALHAKFTPARTILQLDDLLLKYDAVPEDLVFVLAQEFMKWWEVERIEAGGPVSGGWGAGSVLVPETGDRVSAKVFVETKFKAIYVPLLLNYVASHQEQMMLLEKLESNARTSDKLMRNHVNQLMALYKFDVLDADAILEWWKLLKEPPTVFGHGDGIRSMSSKFVAWLEDEEESEDEDSDSDSDSDDAEDDDDEEEDSDEEPMADFDAVDGSGQGKILGLDMLQEELLSSPRNSLQFLDEDLARKDELMVIGSDDGIDDASTTSSLERIEECERKRRISFCTNNVYIHQNGHVKIKKAPEVDEREKKLSCPPMEVDDENDDEDNGDDANDEEDDE